MIDYFDKNGLKLTATILLVILFVFIILKLTNSNNLELGDLIYECFEMTFSILAAISGSFSFLIAGYSDKNDWGKVADLRTYVAVGSLLEVIASVLFILAKFGFISIQV